MDCANFIDDLERVMSGALDERGRQRALDDLTRHAASCHDCAGAGELLAWLALPVAERDIAEDPGRAYWDGFNDRLRRRIVAAGPVAERGRGRWGRWIGAAAAILAVSLLAWIALRPGDDAGATRASANETGNERPEPSLVLPTSLVEMIADDPTAWRDYGLGAEGSWAGSGDDAGWVFPDVEDLDPEARDELLEWLRERTPEEAGVRS
jgi:hypothetical protein